VQADDEVVTSVATVLAVENCVVRVIEHVNSEAVITTAWGRVSKALPLPLRRSWVGCRCHQKVMKKKRSYVISGLLCDVNGICALLAYHATWNGSSVPTFRGNLSVPSSRIKQFLLNHIVSEIRNVRPVPFF